MITSHAFDRAEAFQLFLGLISASNGKESHSRLQLAIELAKLFDAHMDSLPDSLSVPHIPPCEVFFHSLFEEEVNHGF